MLQLRERITWTVSIIMAITILPLICASFGAPAVLTQPWNKCTREMKQFRAVLAIMDGIITGAVIAFILFIVV